MPNPVEPLELDSLIDDVEERITDVGLVDAGPGRSVVRTVVCGSESYQCTRYSWCWC